MENNGGGVTPEKYSNNISDGEDSKIMVLPICVGSSGVQTLCGRYLDRAVQIGKSGDPSPPHRSLRRPTAPESELPLSFLFHFLSSRLDCGAQEGTDRFSSL